MPMTNYLPAFAEVEEIADEWRKEYETLRADLDAAYATRAKAQPEYDTYHPTATSERVDRGTKLAATMKVYELEAPLLENELAILSRLVEFAPKARAANLRAAQIADATLSLARETVRQRFLADYPAAHWSVPADILDRWVETHPVVHAARNRHRDISSRAGSPVIVGDTRAAAQAMQRKLDEIRARMVQTKQAIEDLRRERQAEAERKIAEAEAARKSAESAAKHRAEIEAEARKRLNLSVAGAEASAAKKRK